jgi:hypothetical protein
MTNRNKVITGLLAGALIGLSRDYYLRLKLVRRPGR